MTERHAHIVRLADYRPPNYLIDHVDLTFELAARGTRVESTLTVRRNGAHDEPLWLDGDELTLESIALDGKPLAKEQFEKHADGLSITGLPDQCRLTLVCRVDPIDNTTLDGLYQSSGNFCTQCEAEGFRRITYFPDRPDVLSCYRVTLIADKASCPVLLSNGNPVESRDLDDGRHLAVWEDPHPKPSYLFALVAGHLKSIHDQFTTCSGRTIDLGIYVEPHNIDRCDHAMRSLIKSMAWDEETYGREYDLDVFNIVAVDDFNMGAMENKGLNVFNSKFILARSETATDHDYEGIESVVAHEYFHNWSGNRVTCRDWFQLSLKEGFTVFRDQEFSADMGSRAVKRIEEVNLLRQVQFPEDAGPQAHPVQPKEYEQINNFYTATVYNKGAEVVRMWHNLLGWDAFRRGTDRYFERFDGQAVTIEDFIDVMAEQADFDAAQFRRWYDRAGTPIVHVRKRLEGDELVIDFRQEVPAVAGQDDDEPFLIPIGLAGFDPEGHPVALGGPDGDGNSALTVVLSQKRESRRFSLPTGASLPVLSLNRGFTAPVKIEHDYDERDLALLAGADTDEFNRWDAYQRLVMKTLVGRVRDAEEHGEWPESELPKGLSEAFGKLAHSAVSTQGGADPRFVAECLALPSENYIAEQFTQDVPVEAIHRARNELRAQLANEWSQTLVLAFEKLAVEGGYRFDGVDVGRRALRAQALSYLNALDHPAWRRLAAEQLREADNMTERFNALTALSLRASTEREEALESFADEWKDDPLVMDKWLALRARIVEPGDTETLAALEANPAFSIRNPNRVRSLVGTFSRANPVAFHASTGSGYRWVADKIIEIDGFNPQIAARMATVFSRWRRYDGGRADRMRGELERMLDRADCSPDLAEIAGKALK
ncbi:aminopeptidase N [Guyparkeria halopsychrophila]|uniref:aminopeptidase N n=1 Tax=Guyparkeria halopsychrophila TaxID=3139421 RepID=UPI0037C679CC